jgi:hypothetical protein
LANVFSVANRCLEIRRHAIHHVAPKAGVVAGKVRVGDDAFDGAQCLRRRIGKLL